MYLAIAVEPTNEIAATCGWSSSASTHSRSPWTMLNTPVRQAGLDQQLAQPHRRERHFFRRLQDERVAAGDARSGYIHSGTIDGKLYGVMPTQTPTGCRTASASTSPAMFGSDLAHDQARDAAGELDHLDAAVDLGPGLGERLAMLAGDERGELLEVFLQQRAEAEHHAGPLDDRRLGSRPGARQRRLRRLRRFPPPSQNGTRAITWPVDGLKTSPKRLALSSTHLPPRRMGSVSTLV